MEQKRDDIFKSIFEGMPLGVATYRVIPASAGSPPVFVFEEANEAFKRILEVEGLHVEGKKVGELIPSGNLDEWNRALSFSAGPAAGGLQSEFFLNSPIHKWVHVRAYPIGDIRVAAIYTDITHDKRLESALSLERSFLKTVSY